MIRVVGDLKKIKNNFYVMSRSIQGQNSRLSLSFLPWHQRLTTYHVTLFIFIILIFVSWPSLRGSERDLNYWENIKRFMGYFFPPDFSVSLQTWRGLIETVQIAVMATFFAILISVPAAMAASQNLAPRWIVVCARFILSGIRAIPSLIWALLAVVLVGANSLAGVVALTFYSLGYLGKFFSDAFESVDPQVSEGLRAMGAGSIQSFQYGLWPHAKPLIWSQSLWMLEYNIRSATIIGYVGAGGLGVQLHTYQEYGQWNKFSAVLFYILLIVIVLDVVGERLRREVSKTVLGKSLKEK